MMDFVERLLGWAPYGGDGTFELMLLTAGCCGRSYDHFQRRPTRRSSAREAMTELVDAIVCALTK
jgi:hypothetical protein